MDEKIKQLLIDFTFVEDGKSNDEAFASINLNPAVSWAKFILTDDQPNANKQRVPIEEFENLINTGIYMPIKMAVGQINDGHDDAYPLGTIAHLKKVNNQIHGLACLWDRERPDDISLIKDAYKEGKPLQLSWEILYKDSTVNDNGVEELRNTALRATTLVGLPAYAGRTPITAVASTVSTQNVNSELEDLELDELEQAKARITELEGIVTSKDTEIQSYKDQLAELDTLKQFKASIEQAKAELEKLNAIKVKFTEAKITKSDDYFDTNKDKFLKMDDDEIDFFIQELAAFNTVSASVNNNPSAPNISTIVTGTPTVAELAEWMRKAEQRK